MIKKITWEEYDLNCRFLVNAIRNKYGNDWDSIIAIARGGLPVATVLSHAMNIRKVDTIRSVTYDDAGRKLPQPYLDYPIELLRGNGMRYHRVLVVDDIVDTGVTFEMVTEWMTGINLIRTAENKPRIGFIFATLYSKLPFDMLGMQTVVLSDKETWIEFPYERA